MTRPRRARFGPDVALLGASLAASLGAARLTQAPAAARVVGPIVAVSVVGYLAAALTRRVRAPLPVVLGAGVITVALATVWGELWSATRGGVPTATTWRALVDRLDAAGTVIRSNPTPVPASSGVVLCLALGAGLVAVLGATLWAWQDARPAGSAFRSPRPLVALVPSFGLFCYTALLSSEVDRVQGTFAYLAGALLFVMLADRPVTVSSRRARLVVRASAFVPGAIAAAVAVALASSASPGLASLRVSALPFPTHSGVGVAGFGLDSGSGSGLNGAASFGGPARGGPSSFAGVRAIDLVDDLQAVLTNRTTELMFSAATPVPTYWQIAVLTRFDGRTWAPDQTTLAAINDVTFPPEQRSVPGLPSLPEPKPSSTYTSTVTVAALQSTLLPLPPGTVSLSNANAVIVPGFGAIQPYEASPGSVYSAVVAVPSGRAAPRGSPHSSTASGASSTPNGSGAPSSPSPSSLAPYLSVPRVSPQIVTLAHQIVAGANGPAAQATALARWFNSGRFRYTLTPPVAGAANPLASFLFTTREGFCQQFAAAYAALARIDGLPTRVAVGFTTGTFYRGQYRVTGADAHVWPEVYLGPSAGWTSFEPTPASSSEPNGAGVITGGRSNTPGTPAASQTSSPTIPLAHRPSITRPPTPSTVPLTTHGRPSITTPVSSWVSALVTALVVLGVVALVLALASLGRRRLAGRIPPWRVLRRRLERGWRRGRGVVDPTDEVLAHWRAAAVVLERARLGRRPAETLHEHAARLESLARARWLSYTPAALPSSAHPDASRPTTTGPATTEAGATSAIVSGLMERDPIEAAVEAYRRLADLASRASYASDPCTPDEAEMAFELSDTVRTGLVRPGRAVRTRGTGRGG